MALRTIAYAVHCVFQDFCACEPGEISPEREAELDRESESLDDELHRRVPNPAGEHEDFATQIMLASDGRYCLHLFQDGSCFGCGCGQSQVLWMEVLDLVGGEAALLAADPRCADWLGKAKLLIMPARGDDTPPPPWVGAWRVQE
jgi:hypothetical protein